MSNLNREPIDVQLGVTVIIPITTYNSFLAAHKERENALQHSEDARLNAAKFEAKVKEVEQQLTDLPSLKDELEAKDRKIKELEKDVVRLTDLVKPTGSIKEGTSKKSVPVNKTPAKKSK